MEFVFMRCNNNCNESNLYVRFQTALTSIKNNLGINCIQWYFHKDLNIYIYYIIEYINSKLILSGASTLEQYLEEFSIMYQDGTDKIINGCIEELLFEMNVDSSDPYFREDLFCLAWGNLMTSIYLTLNYNYSHLFVKQDIDCHSSCNECSENYENPGGINNVGSWKLDNFGCGCNGN